MSAEFEPRSQLFQQLSALPKPQFEEVLFALKKNLRSVGQNPTRPSKHPTRRDTTHGTPPENLAILFIVRSVAPASWLLPWKSNGMS
ncbi:MAG: hypothetical protein AAGE59_12800 [Cyanobacteria bacterium P01_F01_bin.86]